MHRPTNGNFIYDEMLECLSLCHFHRIILNCPTWNGICFWVIFSTDVPQFVRYFKCFRQHSKFSKFNFQRPIDKRRWQLIRKNLAFASGALHNSAHWISISNWFSLSAFGDRMLGYSHKNSIVNGSDKTYGEWKWKAHTHTHKHISSWSRLNEERASTGWMEMMVCR